MGWADILNVLSYRSGEKVCVFLVDDYGHLGIAKDVTKVQMESCPGIRHDDLFNRYDSLESPEDLHALFDTLSGFKGSDNKPAVFTPIVCAGNPDLNATNADAYHWESFDQTLQTVYGTEVLDLWRQGMEAEIFQAELHGREHVHPGLFLTELKEMDPAFGWMKEHSSLAVLHDGNPHLRPFQLLGIQDNAWQRTMLEDAVRVFERFFGRKPVLFVPPGLIHAAYTEELAAEMDILYLDSARSAKRSHQVGKTRREIAWTGKRSNGVSYLCRNAMFEPSAFGERAISQTMQSAEKAFSWKVPLVISSHRVNYTGARDESNRYHGLEQLRKLLGALTKKYPDMRFLSAGRLIEEMTG